MSYLHAAVLGLVQGLTEFLPISSSGHLFLVSQLSSWPDQGVLFDAVLHLGTLVAIGVALRREWVVFFKGAWAMLATRQLWRTPEQRLVTTIVVATIPGALAGYAGEALVAETFRSGLWVGLGFAATAGFFLLAEALSRYVRTRTEPTLLGGVAIGVAQMVALLPGVSRSGMTMTTGMLVGLKREAAARFSFLLAAPITLGAVAASLLQLKDQPAGDVAWGPLTLGVVVAMLVGVAVINWLLRYLKTRSFVPFAVYLLALSALVLVLTW